MDKGLLLCIFLIGLVVGGGCVTGYMYLSDDSPLMARQKAFDDTAKDLIELSKQCSVSK
ncbi:hypothetical protein [Vibrio scophthalmi]|uniref:Lipoprotein n=1 Tax=Vibrio scophthalmi TaxID=45658 RepID=A0A1E3WJI6_9VIBR|nr:hypothetical protein [Vibrio scophthalmi]ODS09631.1 hypothetical protein VSF3289_03295 [Vibrio scophthalmi]